MKENLNNVHSLSHTKWNCKYHVVFAPKYRKKAFYGARRLEIGAILRQLCQWKDELANQLTMENYDPFTGSKNSKA